MSFYDSLDLQTVAPEASPSETANLKAVDERRSADAVLVSQLSVFQKIFSRADLGPTLLQDRSAETTAQLDDDGRISKEERGT